MFHEFDFITQTVVIQNPIVIEDNGVIETATAREACLPQCFEVAHEAESARATDLFYK